MTNKEKVEALRKLNPKLSIIEACKLLGISKEDYEKENSDTFINFFNDMIKDEK